MKAYFEQAELMSDHGTLVRLASEAGLDAAEATDVLAGDSYAAAVRADEAQARELGITGVPCFVFDRQLCGERRAILGGDAERAFAGVVRALGDASRGRRRVRT